MKNKLSYQEAFSELQDIVNKIETGEVEIDALSDMIKRASKLIEVCNAKLTATENEVDKLLEKLEQQEIEEDNENNLSEDN